MVVAESLGDALCATAQLFAAEDEESSPQDHMWIAALLKWVSLHASFSYVFFVECRYLHDQDRTIDRLKFNHRHATAKPPS